MLIFFLECSRYIRQVRVILRQWHHDHLAGVPAVPPGGTTWQDGGGWGQDLPVYQGLPSRSPKRYLRTLSNSEWGKCYVHNLLRLEVDIIRVNDKVGLIGHKIGD